MPAPSVPATATLRVVGLLAALKIVALRVVALRLARHVAALRIVALLVAAGVIASACGSRQVPIGADPSAASTPPATAPASPATTAAAPTEAQLRARAAEAVTALRDKDFAKLASLAHPGKGVRFSPYAFVDTQRNVLLPVATLAQGFTNRQQYLWGHTDGQGLPMDWILEDYYARHLWKKDFSKATTIVLDQRTGRGNTTDNSAQAYPGARVVEYHLPSVNPSTTLDWASLRLVFEQQAGSWVLVGVIRDEWTI